LTEIINNSKQKNTKQHKEEEDDGEKVERTRVAPAQTNVYFGDLKPDTEYKIGVLAYMYVEFFFEKFFGKLILKK